MTQATHKPTLTALQERRRADHMELQADAWKYKATQRLIALVGLSAVFVIAIVSWWMAP